MLGSGGGKGWARLGAHDPVRVILHQRSVPNIHGIHLNEAQRAQQ